VNTQSNETDCPLCGAIIANGIPNATHRFDWT
jgi:hypothetical protein